MTPEQARALAGSYYQDCKEPLAKSIANPETAKYLRTRAAGLNPSMKNLANAAMSQDNEWHKTKDTMQHLDDVGAKRGKYDAIRGKPVNYEAIYHPSTDHPVEVTGDMDPIEAAVRQNVRFRNATTGAGRDRTLNTSAFFEQGHIPNDNPNRDTFESIDKGELHIPTWDEIRKSIANRRTKEYLHEKYKPYPGYISERRNEREGPHQPSIQSAIEALTSQLKEDQRISGEREAVSDAGWDRGVKDAQAIIDQYKGKIPDEEIIKRLNALQSSSAPTDFRPSDEGISPDEQYMRAMNYAGYVEHLDGADNDFFAGDRTGGPNEDPVVSAVRNNVHHQESLRNNRDERLDMARSVGAGRRRSRFEHESEEEKKGEKEEE